MKSACYAGPPALPAHPRCLPPTLPAHLCCLPAYSAIRCRLQYTFTATPLNGGAPVVVTSPTPEASFTGLESGTQYEVSVTATLPNGSATPISNMLSFVTPAEK